MKTTALSITALFTLGASLTAPATAAAAETYVIDPVHSAIIFKINHLGVSNAYGMFEDFEGEVTFDEENPANSKINLTVNTASVDTNNEKRDEHLRSTDFFSSQEFPTATFESTEVSSAGDGIYEVTGDLTLLGVTKPVTLDFQEIGKGEGMQGETRRGGEGTVSFKRSDFGMTKYIEEGVLGDETTLIIALEGILKEE
jgi:polyisoprenoid-binding protein YceI